MLFLLEMSKSDSDLAKKLKSEQTYTESSSEPPISAPSKKKRTPKKSEKNFNTSKFPPDKNIIAIPTYARNSSTFDANDYQDLIEERDKAKVIYETMKEAGYFKDFFNEHPNFDPANFTAFRNVLYQDLVKQGIRKGSNAPTDVFPYGVDGDTYWKIEKRINVVKNKQEPKKDSQEVSDKISQEVPSDAPNEESQNEVFDEVSQEFQSEVPNEESRELVPKQNLVQLYEEAQRSLADVGIDTPLDKLILPRELKERLLAHPRDVDVVDDVVREASKNYAINVYKQRYQDIEDNAFKSFLEEAVNDGLINPYAYFDKNREQHIMYLYGDKPMSEPELRDMFNKQRFKNLIKSGKNKLHEAAERAIMKKREKQKQAYEEMKQTTRDEIRPKLVLNPMLFKHY